MKVENLTRGYSFIAVLILNTLVFFVVLNLIAHIVLSVIETIGGGDPVTEKYGAENIKKVYPELAAEEVKELLRETWSRPYVYEPFTQFKERAFEGKYVNVSPAGYRVGANQGTWPPIRDEFNVFLLGGSTTFGYGLSDAHTIGSYLQGALRDKLGKKINVYNFGRGFYFSSQERILFESLISQGHIPNLVIFIDGLNDFYHYDGRPLYTDRFENYVNKGLPKSSVAAKLPIVRLFFELLHADEEGLKERDSGAIKARYDDPAILSGVVERYIANKKLIEVVGVSHEVKTFFVWQPVPTFNYDLRHHLFAGTDFGAHTFSQHGYPLIKKYFDEHPQPRNFLWAADIQGQKREPLYVDQVHYTSKFSKAFAVYIAENLIDRYPELNELETSK